MMGRMKRTQLAWALMAQGHFEAARFRMEHWGT
jgi:hypothetical protein